MLLSIGAAEGESLLAPLVSGVVYVGLISGKSVLSPCAVAALLVGKVSSGHRER